MLCMSKTLKMVFAAFMQHCIQNTVTHLTHVEDIKDAKQILLYSVYRAPQPSRGESYLFEPSVLWV